MSSPQLSASDTDLLLSANGLTIHRNGRKVLDGASIDVRAGESVSIMGPSGSGKSTLLHCLAGLITPDHGNVRCSGLDLGSLSAAKLRAWRLANCGLVFQFGELLPELTLQENAELPLLLLGMDRAIASKRVSALFRQVQIGDVSDRTPGQVSGGQMQRAAIVRALAHRPTIVLADEPTGALDAASGHVVLDALVSLARSDGQALVIVTHDHGVSSKADRQLIMSDGVLKDANPLWV